MPRYFDDDELDVEEPTRDTEVTLTPGGVAAAVLGLLLVCGLCFGLGYFVGHHSSGGSSSAGATPAHTAAPDQEPLQANGAIPKPPAAAQAPVAAQGVNDGSQAPGSTPDSGANPASPAAQPQGPAAPAPVAAPSAPPVAAPQNQSPVRPAMPSAGYPAPQGGASPNVRAALPAPGQLMVQVAAVSHEEDADVLMNALRRRGYAVTSQRFAGDGLIHVRIGPFATREEATRMARRLLDDGYNAIVQP